MAQQHFNCATTMFYFRMSVLLSRPPTLRPSTTQDTVTVRLSRYRYFCVCFLLGSRINVVTHSQTQFFLCVFLQLTTKIYYWRTEQKAMRVCAILLLSSHAFVYLLIFTYYYFCLYALELQMSISFQTKKHTKNQTKKTRNK